MAFVFNDTILGWLTKGEATLLYDFAMKAPIPRVIEFGAFCGKSAHAMGQAMRDRNGLLISLDQFTRKQSFWGKREDIVVNDVFEAYWKNMVSLGLEKYVMTMQGFFNQSMTILHGKFGMAFIDGDHVFTGILPQFSYCWKNVVEGGFIAFHDYTNKDWPDVKMAVDFLCQKYDRKIIASADGTVVIQR